MSKPSRTSVRTLLCAGLLAVAGPAVHAQSVTTPMAQFGHNIGDDYWLATYTQLTEYWQKLATESPRMVLDTIGYTAEGRPHLMAIITSPANHANLEQHKRNARRLALASDLSEAEARALSETARAVVWIDGGLHATEVLGAAQLMEMAYQMVSLDDAETRRFLDDVITLLVHANPDGMELVSSWYMREPDPLQRSTGGIPRLYQKYVGHDNNRDSYMVTQPETENISRIMFREWYPQIMYNHHQTGPSGTVLFAPPFRDPPNHNVHPLVTLGIQAVGTAIHQRLVAEGKPGSTMRQGASYSAWFNGNLRTTSYFHNMIGILTETQGNPTPMRIQFVPDRLLAINDLPAPIEPQEWHFRQSVDYSITNNRAILDYASRYRETLLFNRYRMAQDAIERGSEDSWTIRPKLVASVTLELTSGGRGGFGRGGLPPEGFQLFRNPDLRDPRGYIIPSDQADFPTAVKFVNTLEKNGVTIHRATEDFTVAGTRYPANSLIVRSDQAYAPHVYDMFEPQDHPNDFEYDGGPPIPPYDNAGYTLALQMGVAFDRILDGFDGPFEVVQGLSVPPPGRVTDADDAAGFFVSHAVTDAVIATNRLLGADQKVYWISAEVTAGGQTWPAGTLWVPATTMSRALIAEMAPELGLDFVGVVSTPSVDALELSPVLVGLWDRYGGSMSSGWTRWMLEQYEFAYEVVYPQALNEPGLENEFDVLIFEDGGIPGGGGGGRGFGGGNRGNIPQGYQHMLGSVTAESTIPNLIDFVKMGGTLLAIGSSTAIAAHAGLPMTNHLRNGDGEALSRAEYYIPSSVLEMAVDNTHPLGYGFGDHTNIMFNNSPVFRLLPQATSEGVTPVAWFDSETPLRSGWAWGENRLFGGTAVSEARLGEGRILLFGPLIKKRAQPHATFKFLFNGILLGGATPVRLGGVAE